MKLKEVMADSEVQVDEEWLRPLDNRYINTYEVSNTGYIRNRCNGTVIKPFPNKAGNAMVNLVNDRGKPTTMLLWKLIAMTFMGDISGKMVKFKDKNKMNVAVSNLELIDKNKVDFDLEKEVWRDIEDEEFFGRYAVSNMGRVKMLFRSWGYMEGYILSRLHQTNKAPYVELKRRDGTVARPRVVDLVSRAFIGDNKGLDVQYHDGDKTNVKVDNLYYAGKYISYQQQPIYIGCNDGWRITRLTHRGTNRECIDYLVNRFQKEAETYKLDLRKVEAFLGNFTNIFCRFVPGLEMKSQLVRYDVGGEEMFAFHVTQQGKVLLKIFPPNDNGRN